MYPRSTLPSNSKVEQVQLLVYRYNQDDPRKCTAARLVHLNLARTIHSLRQIPRHAIVLNPTSEKILRREDRLLAGTNGIVGLDCSWNRAQEIFQRQIPGENRRLPSLLAGNPTNYAAVGKLSTVEALSASLNILGYRKQAIMILQPFPWGTTFNTLNKELLDAYAGGSLAEADRLDRALRHQE